MWSARPGDTCVSQQPREVASTVVVGVITLIQNVNRSQQRGINRQMNQPFVRAEKYPSRCADVNQPRCSHQAFLKRDRGREPTRGGGTDPPNPKYVDSQHLNRLNAGTAKATN